MNSSRNWVLVLLVLIVSVALADNKKQEYNALIARARQLSEIRADGLPPFQMKVSFKIIKKDSTTSEGTYSETWASRDKWRSETVVGDYHRVTVVNGDRSWISNISSDAPIGIGELGFKMELPKLFLERTDRIRDRERNSRMMRCLETKPGLFGRSALCFDKATGLVAENVQPVARGSGSGDRTCTYTDYQPFGERTFPRSIRCSEDHEPVLESTLIELTKVPSPDAALFAPLANGKESVNCRGTPNPPEPIYQSAPVPPRRQNLPYPIVLWLSLGTDGIPTDVKIVRSFDPAFDNAAIEAVRAWRFKPASCDGQPMEVQINVEVNFRFF
jgi:TonB family protein